MNMEKLNKFNLIKNRIYNYVFKENFFRKIKIDFPKNIYRWHLIQFIIDKYYCEHYLEIGCDDDHCFSKINIKNKIGVDPYSGGNFRGTSNEFFKKNTQLFDIIFIDGLHHYDQCLIDVENSIRFIKPNGFILLHDCLPRSIAHQAIPRYRGSWNGDIWKVVVNLRTRENINTLTCKIDMGVAVINIKQNKKKLNIKTIDFKDLKFRDYYYNYKEYMNIIDYEELLKIL